MVREFSVSNSAMVFKFAIAQFLNDYRKMKKIFIISSLFKEK